jgi:hypothetical protein
VHSRSGDDLGLCHVAPPVELGDVLELGHGRFSCSASSTSWRRARAHRLLRS